MKTMIMTLAAMAVLLTGCTASAQNMETRTLNVGSFTGISASVFDVDYFAGPQKAVKIVAPADLINEVEVTVKENRLHIRKKSQNRRLRDADMVKITVTAPAVNSFNASAGADLNIRTEVNSGSRPLNLNASSGADLKLSTGRGGIINVGASSGGDIHAVFLTSTNINLTASSAADIRVNRMLSSGSLNANASSGADIRIDAVKCKNSINTDASSGADIKISGIETVTINADASSGADIELEGKATRISRSSSSGGSIETRNLNY